MSDQQPPPHWGPPHVAPPVAPPGVYAPPRAREVTASYRRWTVVLTWAAVVVAALMAFALVMSIVFLVWADQDTRNAAYGYLALVLWVGIAAGVPVLIAVTVSARDMRRRVRQQNWTGNG
ncbi:hypothetical protein N7925_19285 [Streptomyces sp. CA-278952]|uniref:hypothetical protein n=1 Tax=unclassified Streptomyces TaxID=2593676 RepID=UPI002242A9FA|nr:MULTISPECIES: hypothetical protein [unclassified Streptomyces]UZI30334.1 hypothetical protein OH133_20695 [Streptomyces sp. VB1]WDG30324.1 hypothetical protein N7925_19285 [Streptomyces sp. CA-278952]